MRIKTIAVAVAVAGWAAAAPVEASTGATDDVLLAVESGAPEVSDTQPGRDREREVIVSDSEIQARFTSPTTKVEVGDPVVLEFFDGQQRTFTTKLLVPQASPQGAEATWYGEITNAKGELLEFAGVVVHHDETTGQRSISALSQDGEQTIIVEPGEGDRHRMYEADESEVPEWHEPALDQTPVTRDTPEVAASSATSASTPISQRASTRSHRVSGSPRNGPDVGRLVSLALPPGGAKVRILVAYANGMNVAATQTYINEDIARTIWALAASGIPATVELAGLVPANYSIDNPNDDIDRLTFTGGLNAAMDGLHDLRDQYDADLVALAVPNYSTGGCTGLGWVPNASPNRAFGFSLASVDPDCRGAGQYLFTHEVGHNLGGHHDPGASSPPDGRPFTYSKGHCVSGVALDVMAYTTVCGGSDSFRELQFSSPLRSFTGHPSHPSGTSTRDNARSISQVVWPISSFEDPGTAGNDSLWRGLTGRTFASSSPQDHLLPHEPIAGDFDGDGNSDLFWYEPGEAPESVWYFNDLLGKTTHSESVNGTYLPLSGDFDGDGRDDVFWYAPGGGSDFIWWGRANRGELGDFVTPKTVTQTFTPFVGDFDGDNRDDVFWYAAGSATDWIWWGTTSPADFGVSPNVTGKEVNQTYQPLSGDFDGDGYDDAFWYAPGSTSDFIWWGQASRPGLSSPQSSKAVGGTYEPAVGDFDADGEADVFWYGPGTAGDFLWWGLQADRSGFGGTQAVQTVNGYYTPRAGNYDSLQGDDLYWFLPG